MTYMDSLQSQLRILLQVFGFGFLLGFLYDVFRTLRLLIGGGRKAFWIADVLYFTVCTCLSFLLLLVINEGKVRMYTVLGESAGWLVYYFTLGFAVMKLCDATVAGIRRCRARVRQRLLFPIGRKISRIFAKRKKKIDENMKKSKKVIRNSKLHLKIIDGMVYNLFEIVKTRKDR